MSYIDIWFLNDRWFFKYTGLHLSYGRLSYFLSFFDALSYTFLRDKICNLSVQPV